MALIDRINTLNRCLPDRKYVRLYVNEVAVGFVDTQILTDLSVDIFTVSADQQRIDIRFKPSERQAFEKRIEAFFRDLFHQKKFTGWRNEYYRVAASYQSETLFTIERAALSYLGITGHGVHVNGYVKKADGLYLWIAKRSLDKPTSPGKLDQIAAGGIPHHLSAFENVIKECQEEASIPETLSSKAIPVSAIAYCYDLPIGMRPDVIFSYDLLLPEDFVPQVNDNEVESFTLYPIEALLEMLEQSEVFKFNSAAVVIDFAIRHGVITPEHPDYLALQSGMYKRYLPD